MSTNNTSLLHPLTHAGTSQTERLVTALLPENLQIDERSLQDLLVAAHRYAQLLHYYDEDNQIDGDWTSFWEVETLTFLAILAELDTEAILQQYNELEIGYAEDIPEGAGGPLDPGGEEITNAYDLAEFIHRQVLELNKAYTKLPDSLALKAEIAGMIDKKDVFDGENLVDALHQLIAVHKHAYGKEHDGDFLPYADYAPFFGDLWSLADSNAFEVIKYTADYDRESLRNLFRRFYDVLIRIRHRARYWFEQEIASPQLHEPHVALFLTFLRLFRHAQNSLNALTGRHLDYYYEEILCMVRRAAVSDDVYLVLELAKGFEHNLIEKGTEFLAGKDKNGQPLVFTALEEYVVRGAQVAELKTIHFGLCEKASDGKILANPDVNLAYNNGAEDPAGEVVSWRSMGDNKELPPGEIGFAIASPQLILREGFRVIDVEMELRGPRPATGGEPLPIAFEPAAGDFRLELSSGEDIIEITEAFETLLGNSNEVFTDIELFDVTFVNNILHFRIHLERDAPPVIAPTGERNIFNSQWPVLSIYFNKEEKRAEFYQNLRNVYCTEIVITVDVEGIRENLIIQSDQGVFDGTQQVLPFGAVPGVGRRFYVGSTEIFQKALEELTVYFEWLDEPQDITYERYYCHYNALGYSAPRPKVEIDFIDRAASQDINIEQEVRLNEVPEDSIELPGNLELKFKVTDVVFTAVIGVSLSRINDDGTQTDLDVEDLENGNYETLSIELSEGTENISLLLEAIDSNLNLEPLQFDLKKEGRWASEMELVLFPKQLNFINTDNGVTGRVGNWGGFAMDSVSVNSGPITNGGTGDYSAIAQNTDVLVFELNEEEIGNVQHFNNNVVNVNLDHPQGNVIGEVSKSPPSNTVDTLFVFENMSEDSGSIAGEEGEFEENFLTGSTEIIMPGISGESIIRIQQEEAQTLFFPLEHATEVAGIRLLKNAPSMPDFIEPPTNSDTITVLLPAGSAVDFTDSEFNITVNGGEAIINEGSISITFDADADTVNLTINHPRYLETSLPNLGPGSEFTVDLVPKVFEDEGPTNSNTDSIEVLVIDKNGAIDNLANVEVFNANGEKMVLTFSDASNRYSAQLTLAGNLRLRVGREGESFFTAISPTDVNVLNRRIVINNGLVEKSRPFRGLLSGGINLANGQRIAGAVVGIERDGETNTSITDANGEFAFTGLDVTSTSNISLNIRHPFYKDFSVSLPLDDDSRLDVTVLPRNVSRGYSGVVRDIFQLPQPNIPFVIEWEDRDFEIGLSDALGNYRFSVPYLDDDTTISPVVKVRSAGFKDLDINIVNPNHPGGISGPYKLDINLFPEAVLSLPLISGSNLENRFIVPINALNLERDIRTQEFERYDPTLKRGFIRFTLKESGFGHSIYPNLLAAYAIAASTETNTDAIVNTEGVHPCGADTNSLLLPNPPYTPATNGIRIDYKSRQVIPIEIGTGEEENDGIDRFFHLLPFTGYRNSLLTTGESTTLLDPFHPHDLPVVEEYADGNLYIGLQNLEPDTVLSLLIQIEEGTERKPDWQPPKIVWSYLVKDNEWKQFRTTDVLEDGTRSLTKSGLVKLKIPKTIVRENTMLNPELHWLRIAAVEDRADAPPQSVHALPSLVSVRAQAIQARFSDRENDLAHLADPLGAKSISKLLVSRTAVKKVEQPYDSFNGRLPEQGNEFYRRISERLRHRERAITIWDYEHLLLEAFPKVRRVKCLSHTRPGSSPDNCGTEVIPTEDLLLHRPGYVTLAVIPDLAQRTATQQAEPRFSFGDLLDMEDFLRQHTNLFVAWQRDKKTWLCAIPDEDRNPDNDLEEPNKYLWVVNPTYEYIRLCFKVAFRPGLDPTFYRYELNRELKNFLAPWLVDPMAEIRFERSLYQSAIITFIEQRSYVDVIGDFQLFKSMNAGELEDLASIPVNHPIDTDLVRPSSPRAILTTFEWSDLDIDDPDHDIISVEDVAEICVTKTPPTVLEDTRGGT